MADLPVRHGRWPERWRGNWPWGARDSFAEFGRWWDRVRRVREHADKIDTKIVGRVLTVRLPKTVTARTRPAGFSKLTRSPPRLSWASCRQ